jgi:hypothetical protein
MEVVRPLVFVLTDGSGNRAEGRIRSTTRLLGRTGARPGPIYGRMSDRTLYAAVLDRRFDVFIGMTDELAEALCAANVEYVVGDATEGYNPSHDVCRLMVDAAVRLVGRCRGAALPNYDFLLVGAPLQCPDELGARAIWHRLDDDAFARKLDAARSYPELAGEVDAALSRHGTESFRAECLRPVCREAFDEPPAEVPFYETFGAQRVSEGRYAEVLRYRAHVRPLAEALRQHVEGGR